jgi:hypothetical protein
MAKPSFHAFTFGTHAVAGSVTNTNIKPLPRVAFDYSYSLEGAEYLGAFSGEADENGVVRGKWSETSASPVNGKSSWNGTATLKADEEGGRVVFHGTWEPPKGERWVVDIVK